MLVVFGSINVDLVFRVAALPGPGETVLAPGYATVPGGKGANQAVAAARDGARVRMVGSVGRDAFARVALDSLSGAGVDTAEVAQADAATGCAMIAVDDAGENQIVVASGANALVHAGRVDDAWLGPGTTLVLQMEIAPAANAALIRRARERKTRIVLNLAPAAALPEDALRAVDVLVVNRGEARWLGTALGESGGGDDIALVAALAARLGVVVVATRGGDGAVAATRDGVWTVAALPVAPVVDTTGAGDAFVGVLAAALDRGQALDEALHRASAAAGLACENPGAQASLPSRTGIDSALSRLPPARRE